MTLWALGTGAMAGLGIWWSLAPKPAGFSFGPPPAEPIKRSKKALPPAERVRGTARLIWLSGIPLPPLLLKPVSLVFGGLAGLVAMTATRNIPVAVIVGMMAFFVPETLLKNWALARWRDADQEAYVLTNTLQFLLPVFGHPLSALREVAPGIHGPLSNWIAEALAAETTGGMAEQVLFDLGLRLGHAELQLLAEILKADRHEKPSSELLAELIQAWTERVRADKKRQAKLAATKRFTSLIVGLPVVGFVAMGFMAPHVMQVFNSSLAGQAAGAFGMALMGGAASIARSALKQSEEVRF